MDCLFKVIVLFIYAIKDYLDLKLKVAIKKKYMYYSHALGN